MYNISDNFDDILDPMDDDKLERFVNYAQSILEARMIRKKNEALQKLIGALRAYQKTTGEDYVTIERYHYLDDNYNDRVIDIAIPIDNLYITNDNQFSLTDY